MYDRGYVLTRLGKGVMQQTRSLRIDLSKFELTSENRRVLKKTDGITLGSAKLPMDGYNFGIGKMAKDFYAAKFGDGTMSANKIKELCTDVSKSNFNHLCTYSIPDNDAPAGYTICYTSALILHYSYPFYDLEKSPKDMGLGMMIRAIIQSKELGQRYIYLGSLQRPGDVYKLQFSGLEWFDGTAWSTDLDEAKKELAA